MKFGFLGNMNNYPFMLAEALKAKGHDIVFILTRKEPLHRPENRYSKYIDKYPEWIYDFSHLEEMDFIKLNRKIHPVLTLLKKCDILVLNDIGPSLWPVLHKPSVIFFTGSDLDYYANYDTIKTRTAMYSEEYLRTLPAFRSKLYIKSLIDRQRSGIENGILINYAFTGLFPEYDRMLEEIGINNAYRESIQMPSLSLISYSRPPEKEILKVFSATRLNWKQTTPDSGRSLLDYKGSDIMVKGLALFYRETGIKLDIHLVRKGYHVKETEELVKKEGIDSLVTWHEEMSLLDVWDFFKNSDIIFEQLAESIPSMAALDALATGRPVIANTRLDIPTPWSSKDSPICQAATPEEVCMQLRRLVNDRELRIQIGLHGRAFVEKYFSPVKAVETIEKAVSGNRTCFPRLFQFVSPILLAKIIKAKDIIIPLTIEYIKRLIMKNRI